LFFAKNYTNAEDKMSLAKMISKGYYHESKFNWNISKLHGGKKLSMEIFLLKPGKSFLHHSKL